MTWGSPIDGNLLRVLRRDPLVDGEIEGDVPVDIGGTNMHWPRPVKQW